MHHHRICYIDHVQVPEHPLPSFKIEQNRPTYFLSPTTIYGLVIHDASNNTC